MSLRGSFVSNEPKQSPSPPLAFHRWISRLYAGGLLRRSRRSPRNDRIMLRLSPIARAYATLAGDYAALGHSFASALLFRLFVFVLLEFLDTGD